ncbi:MAG: hypothetical protein LBC98_03980 [Prevotellaceae bacterium]|jgi:hypothetical protein|nr:hypothetical protein [Prevotellaceae bacterium]
MTDKQEAKLSMYQSVNAVCQNNSQVYSSVPAMTKAVVELGGGISSILQAAGQQSSTTSQGATMEKNRALDAMASVALKLGNALYVYAFDVKNGDLLTLTSISKSGFYNGHVNEALVLARNISSAAQEHLPELGEYGVDQAIITKLNETIAALENVYNNPRVAIEEHKVYTGNIKQLFARVDSVLHDRMDKLVTLFKESDPNFYALYKNARNIIDTAKRTRKPVEGKDQL